MIEAPSDALFRRSFVDDGRGRPPFVGDLAIRAHRVAKVGDVREVSARKEYDVPGHAIAPGFIDVHAHDDAALTASPEMTPQLRQGVTTVIAGNCGVSRAPFNARGALPGVSRMVFKSDQYLDGTLERYYQNVMDAGAAVNAGVLTGRTTLRMGVMGDDLQRSATDAEAAAMDCLLRDCLAAGSLGLSTGLFYPPARAASTAEVIAVGESLISYGALYVIRMRDEALEIGWELDVSVVISHQKCMWCGNQEPSVETLRRLQEASSRQRIALDLYPHTAVSSVLTADLVAQSIRTPRQLVYAVLPGADLSSDGTGTAWYGLKPVCADAPCAARNLFIDAGHVQLGWTLAACSSQLLTDLIFQTLAAIEPYRLVMDAWEESCEASSSVDRHLVRGTPSDFVGVPVATLDFRDSLRARYAT